jgi:hypothetical protein
MYIILNDRTIIRFDNNYIKLVQIYFTYLDKNKYKFTIKNKNNNFFNNHAYIKLIML